MKKPCKYCGKMYEVSVIRKKYCSDECRNRGYKIVNGVVEKMANCAFCGQPFKKIGKNIYCSKDCKEEGYARQQANLYQSRKNDPEWVKEQEDKRLSYLWPETKKREEDIYDRITRLAEEKNVTLYELFQRCGVSRYSHDAFVNGICNLGIKSLEKIAMHTDKSIDWLLGLEAV